MTTLSYYEYTTVTRISTFDVDEEDVKKLMEDCKKQGKDSDEFKWALEDYLRDIMYDNAADSEIIDENTNDWEWRDETDTYLDDMAEKYEESLSKLGEFGNS